jgi:hypothetical protein
MNIYARIGLLCAGLLLITAGSIFFMRPKHTALPLPTPVTEKKTQDDFQRMGQYSFGVDVCNEMTKDDVGAVLGKSVTKTGDYSNNTSTGCEYYIQGEHFVIVDVGYGDMETQRKGLQILERKLEEDSRIGLPNFLSYSDKGLVDVYMNVAEGKKFVRVGRSNTTVITEDELINLAIAVEKKVRSYPKRGEGL